MAITARLGSGNNLTLEVGRKRKRRYLVGVCGSEFHHHRVVFEFSCGCRFSLKEASSVLFKTHNLIAARSLRNNKNDLDNN
jgi:hypothetical protein